MWLRLETLEGRVVPSVTAQADNYTVLENSFLNTPADTGVLVNDSGDAGVYAGLTANLVMGSGPTHGNLVPFPNTAQLLPNGGFTYRPFPGFTGTDSFEYFDTQIVNGVQETSAMVTVTITVTAQPTSNGSGVAPDADWSSFYGDSTGIGGFTRTALSGKLAPASSLTALGAWTVPMSLGKARFSQGFRG